MIASAPRATVLRDPHYPRPTSRDRVPDEPSGPPAARAAEHVPLVQVCMHCSRIGTPRRVGLRADGSSEWQLDWLPRGGSDVEATPSAIDADESPRRRSHGLCPTCARDRYPREFFPELHEPDPSEPDPSERGDG